MKKDNPRPANIDEYIALQNEEVVPALIKMYMTIKKAAPRAQEVISYGMPAFKLNGILIYFAAFKKHYSFFVSPGVADAFKKELAPYRTGKATISFPFNKMPPVALLTKMVKFTVKRNLEKAKSKTKKK